FIIQSLDAYDSFTQSEYMNVFFNLQPNTNIQTPTYIFLENSQIGNSKTTFFWNMIQRERFIVEVYS
ncbi:MAG: hypothetical protein P8M34_03865, partial [Saprospiraceae bacterium]|nr:hypothetical protein [Saprospiraceae bacterium]